MASAGFSGLNVRTSSSASDKGAALGLDSPDNLCVTPSGNILFCEDDSNPIAGHQNDTDPR